MKRTKKEQEAFEEGYKEGYAKGLYDGNPFNALCEAANKCVESLSQTLSDPDIVQALIEAKAMADKGNEHCWYTGEWTDECDCELCMHKHECSGYEGDDDDE